jgi:four helix bundle protein
VTLAHDGCSEPNGAFRQLKAWQRAVDLVVECDAIVGLLPRTHRATLGVQIRRAAASVPANIAEGNGRRTRADYLRHLSIANGSLMELETHLIVADRLRLVPAVRIASAMTLSGHAGRLLHGLIRALRASRPGPSASGKGPRDPGPDPDPDPDPAP